MNDFKTNTLMLVITLTIGALGTVWSIAAASNDGVRVCHESTELPAMSYVSMWKPGADKGNLEFSQQQSSESCTCIGGHPEGKGVCNVHAEEAPDKGRCLVCMVRKSPTDDCEWVDTREVCQSDQECGDL